LLGGPHTFFRGGDCTPEMCRSLDLETIKLFNLNCRPRTLADHLMENGAGRKLTREECDAQLRTVAEKLTHHAVAARKAKLKHKLNKTREHAFLRLRLSSFAPTVPPRPPCPDRDSIRNPKSAVRNSHERFPGRWKAQTDHGPIPLLHERAAIPFCSFIVTSDATLNS
jgi:hypothetical protein